MFTTILEWLAIALVVCFAAPGFIGWGAVVLLAFGDWVAHVVTMPMRALFSK